MSISRTGAAGPLIAALLGGLHLLCDLDQLLDDLHGLDGTVSVPGDRLFELLGERFRLHQVLFLADLQLVVQQFAQKLDGEVAVRERPDLGEEPSASWPWSDRSLATYQRRKTGGWSRRRACLRMCWDRRRRR
jgi:hypothetical protein